MVLQRRKEWKKKDEERKRSRERKMEAEGTEARTEWHVHKLTNPNRQAIGQSPWGCRATATICRAQSLRNTTECNVWL